MVSECCWWRICDPGNTGEWICLECWEMTHAVEE